MKTEVEPTPETSFISSTLQIMDNVQHNIGRKHQPLHRPLENHIIKKLQSNKIKSKVLNYWLQEDVDLLGCDAV
jgi:hypothetical protein